MVMVNKEAARLGRGARAQLVLSSAAKGRSVSDSFYVAYATSAHLLGASKVLAQ